MGSHWLMLVLYLWHLCMVFLPLEVCGDVAPIWCGCYVLYLAIDVSCLVSLEHCDLCDDVVLCLGSLHGSFMERCLVVMLCSLGHTISML